MNAPHAVYTRSPAALLRQFVWWRISMEHDYCIPIIWTTGTSLRLVVYRTDKIRLRGSNRLRRITFFYFKMVFTSKRNHASARHLQQFDQNCTCICLSSAPTSHPCLYTSVGLFHFANRYTPLSTERSCTTFRHFLTFYDTEIDLQTKRLVNSNQIWILK